MNKAVNIMRS